MPPSPKKRKAVQVSPTNAEYEKMDGNPNYWSSPEALKCFLYRKIPLADKRGKEKFHKSVKSCLSRENVTTVRCRLFSKRAREYVVAYRCLDDPNVTGGNQELSVSIIEKVVKKFKTHRNAADFDGPFVKNVLRGMYSVV